MNKHVDVGSASYHTAEPSLQSEDGFRAYAMELL